MIAAFAFVTTIGTTTPVFATHVWGVVEYEWHIWSRTSSDGHLSYLNCGTGSQSDNCDLKIKTTSGVQGISQTSINSEVDDVEDHFDSLGYKMSIDRVSSANSVIREDNLPIETPGKSVYDMHCTSYFLWWCNGWDAHFIKMEVRLNNNPAEVKFKLAENENAYPKEFDVRKTLGHELFHAMGIDHNSSDDSIVFSHYTFGANNGYEANTTDQEDLEGRYP